MMTAPKSAAGMLPHKLITILDKMPKLAIAFSGGLDSRFLCHAARLCGCDTLAVHAAGPHITQGETSKARNWAIAQGLPYEELILDPLSVPAVAANRRERCYACKKNLMAALQARVAADGRLLCDGGNKDDLTCWRPGIKAVAEAGVISPLALAGLGKTEIRHYAAKSGLDNPEQAPRPCLLTRFAYNLPIDREKLTQAAAVETELGSLLAENAPETDFRLRFLPAAVLHVTKPLPDLQPAIVAILAKYGFEDCPVEVCAPLSGFFDRAVQ